ncbi:hypothetical protein [Phascolarctobacterium faecium]|uniref:hypothetical protein n=1 Tax=Phascolarctobacterium faecium TaxID=33025 RepID=UPI003520F90A
MKSKHDFGKGFTARSATTTGWMPLTIPTGERSKSYSARNTYVAKLHVDGTCP